MKVVILEPAPLQHGWFHSKIETPHLGPPILARIAKNAGHDAVVLSEFVCPIEWDEVREADVVGISINTGLTHQRAYDFARHVRQLNATAVIVAGGHHATMNSSSVVNHVDYVIRGYAERSFASLLQEIQEGITQIQTKGVTYICEETGKLIHTSDEQEVPIGHTPDMDAIRGFRIASQKGRWRLSRFTRYLPLSFHSRGCAFKCNFCSIPLADGPRMSYRSPQEVIDDVREQLHYYNFPYGLPAVWLIDDNFGQHKKTTAAFLEQLIKANLPCRFVVQARVEIGRSPELLQLMSKARFVSVYLGIESVSDGALNTMNKQSSQDKIRRAITAIQAVGIKVVALLMLGNDGDRPGVARKTLGFLDELKIRSICPQITVPYPGTAFHRQMESEGRIFNTDYSLCNLAPVHFPNSIRPSQVVEEMIDLASRHYALRNVLIGMIRYGEVQRFIDRSEVRRGSLTKKARSIVPSLQEFEHPFYDDDNWLLLEKMQPILPLIADEPCRSYETEVESGR